MTRRDGLLLAVLVVVGVVPRWIVGGQALYADELSTYWLMVDHPFLEGLGIVRDQMEITPPVSFVLAGVATTFADGVHWLRLPALVCGLATIPLVALLGARTVGRRAGLLAAALVTLSPFAIFYAAEARAYAPLMLLVTATILAALLALDTGRRRWWVVYAAGNALAIHTHYTVVFVLAALWAWLVLCEPRARRPATLACAAAALVFVPWALTGLRADLASPDSEIVSSLTVFTPRAVVRDVAHWTLGFPYVALGLGVVPGWPAFTVLLAGLALALAGVGAGVVRGRLPRRPPPRVVLLVVLAVATLAGETLVSALGTHQISVRNLASSFPAFVLVLAAAALAAGPRLRVACVAALVGTFAWGAVRMMDPLVGRPPYTPAAQLVDRVVRPGDVVVDGTGAGGSTPGPLTPLDAALDRRVPTLRLGAPQQSERQFGIFDAPVTAEQALAEGQRRVAPGGRIVVVSPGAPPEFLDNFVNGLRANGLDPRWRVVQRLRSPSSLGGIETLVFARG